jgi:hypothetical protein
MISGFLNYNFGDSEVLAALVVHCFLPYGIAAAAPVENTCPTRTGPDTDLTPEATEVLKESWKKQRLSVRSISRTYRLRSCSKPIEV